MNKRLSILFVLAVLVVLVVLVITFLFCVRFLPLINTRKVNKNDLIDNIHEKKIVCCFMIRDGDKYLRKNLLKINNFLVNNFREYQIIYFENDSGDKTKQILSELEHSLGIKGKQVNLKTKNSVDLCKSYINCNKRTRFLSGLRQKLLNEVKSHYYNYDYMLMIDMDFVNFNEMELKNMISIGSNNNYDAIFGMSIINGTNKPYDIGAIRPFYSLIYYYLLFEKSNSITSVNSAFSGFGLYSIRKIIEDDINYDLKTNFIEHIDFNKNMNCYIYNNFCPIYNPSA